MGLSVLSHWVCRTAHILADAFCCCVVVAVVVPTLVVLVEGSTCVLRRRVYLYWDPLVHGAEMYFFTVLYYSWEVI